MYQLTLKTNNLQTYRCTFFLLSSHREWETRSIPQVCEQLSVTTGSRHHLSRSDLQSRVLTQTEDSPLSPKVLNSSLPARALEAATSISLTSCNRKQKTAQTDDCALHVQFLINLFTQCDDVNIPVLLKFSSAAFLHEKKQKRLVNKAGITCLSFMHPSFIHLNVCRISILCSSPAYRELMHRPCS